VNESENGTNYFWTMPENGYPQLGAFSGYQPPPLIGSGTVADPYLIQNADDLGAVYWYGLSLNYRLANNIDLSGIEWIVSPIQLFSGLFEGNGFNVNNLTINGGDYVGLIGKLDSEGQVADLSIEDANVIGNEFVGTLVGDNDGTIFVCESSGTIAGGYSVGGLIGRNLRGTVNSCYSTAKVNAVGTAGGLVGTNYTLITSSHASGSVTGNGSIGGLTGYNDYAEIIDCYATGKVTSSNCVGGLVGQNYMSTITSCYSTGQINPTIETKYIGGLVGYRSSGTTLSKCFWDIETSGTTVGYTYLTGSYPNFVYTPFYGAVGVIEGKTTAEMMTQSTFVVWDFSTPIWKMLRPGEDYPRLAWQGTFMGDIAGLYGVDLVDFAEIARNWQHTGCPGNCEDADVDGSGDVGLGDLVFVVEEWLK
jgi:hypothetical protein